MIILSSNIIIFNFININIYYLINYLLNLRLLIKLGLPPFHYWYINLINNLTWIRCFILSTWQKIIPIILLTYNYNKILLYLIILISVIIRRIHGNNHRSLRIIFSYSSINHIRWILINLIINEILWIIYFLTYLIINFRIMYIFNIINIYYINQINIIFYTKIKTILLINLISITRIPIFLGFFIKWISLYFINKNLNYLIILTILIISLLTFTFYLRISITLIFQNHNLNKNIFVNKLIIKKITPIIIFIFIISFINLWILNNWIN